MNNKTVIEFGVHIIFLESEWALSNKIKID